MKQSHHKIKKVLIANRGEIALRIKKAADELEIASAVVVSGADLSQSYVKAFAEKVILPGNSAAETYLDQFKIIKAAKDLACDAIHPGYGFLSENADFAKKIEEAGLIFIGPSHKSIASLGSKTEARDLATKSKVPVVPGTPGGLTNKELSDIAKKKIGLPLLIKATSGGGGRGMKIVRNWEELPQSLERARAEAKKFFSNDDIFIERYIENPRHVEVQLFGDVYGKIIHFGTRDCSAQRRYQKIIEEAPASCISAETIKKIESAAVRIASAVKYYNAGTAEFIVSGNSFYFLEINTRIQVEHPVTEEISGEDLVKLQFQIAQNKKISECITAKKTNSKKLYALELRIYAEDVEGFMPSLGVITALSLPIEYRNDSEGVRCDFGFTSGDNITPHYDAMIGKLIVWSDSRNNTLSLAYENLKKMKISGIKTNIDFLKWLILYPPFRDGTLSIQQIEREFKPSMIISIKNREIIDSKWKEQEKNLSEKVEVVTLSENKLQIEITHLKDKTFLFVPIIKGRKILDPNLCRRSNSYKSGLQAVININAKAAK